MLIQVKHPAHLKCAMSMLNIVVELGDVNRCSCVAEQRGHRTAGGTPAVSPHLQSLGAMPPASDDMGGIALRCTIVPSDPE